MEREFKERFTIACRKIGEIGAGPSRRRYLCTRVRVYVVTKEHEWRRRHYLNEKTSVFVCVILVSTIWHDRRKAATSRVTFDLSWSVKHRVSSSTSLPPPARGPSSALAHRKTWNGTRTKRREANVPAQHGTSYPKLITSIRFYPPRLLPFTLQPKAQYAQQINSTRMCIRRLEAVQVIPRSIHLNTSKHCSAQSPR